MDIGQLLEGYRLRTLYQGGGASQVTGADYCVQSPLGASPRSSLRSKEGEDFAPTIWGLVLTLCSSLVRLPLALELGEGRVPLRPRW